MYSRGFFEVKITCPILNVKPIKVHLTLESISLLKPELKNGNCAESICLAPVEDQDSIISLLRLLLPAFGKTKSL